MLRSAAARLLAPAGARGLAGKAPAPRVALDPEAFLTANPHALHFPQPGQVEYVGVGAVVPYFTEIGRAHV